MKTLVVIPSLMFKYSFSAPVAWLFSKHAAQVKGVYSFEMTKSLAREHTLFIIELNWYIQLYEFRLLVHFIKKYNHNAKILFGGIHAQLDYQDIFQTCNVDYFIKGDNELPLQMLLDGVNPKTIPNMTGKDFNNPVTYIFKEDDYTDIEFNLDWFENYTKYWFAKPGEDPCRNYDVPLPPHGPYHLPMIITSRGGCSASHQGCEYCYGAKKNKTKEIFQRPPLVISNETLIYLLKKIEKKFKYTSILINSNIDYDLSHCSFDLEATIEFDLLCSLESLKSFLGAFKKTVIHFSVYREGLTGSTLLNNINDYLSLENNDHKIYFFGATKDLDALQIPIQNRLLYPDVIPSWAHWDYYMDKKNALRSSKNWYKNTRLLNLYLPWQRPFALLRAYLWFIKFIIKMQSGLLKEADILKA